MSLYKRGSIWWVEIVHHGQRIRRTTGAETKAAAQEFHDRLKAELWRQGSLGEQPAHAWEDAVIRWLDENEHKKSLSDDKDRLRWLTARLAGRSLVSITSDTVRELIAAKRAEKSGGGQYKRKEPSPLSLSTVNRYMSALSAVLNSAVVWGWIPTAPKIPKLSEPKKRIRYLTREETCSLITELPIHLAEMACFSLATGLRENNVLELEWNQVDTARRIAWAHGDQTKNAKPLAIPLNDEALAVLLLRRGEHPRFVFTYDGHPVSKASNHAWYKALARAGIEEFRWHDLRHTWASWHVMSGTPIEVLKELGGWSDLRMVMRYAHLAPGHVARFAGNAKPFSAPTNYPTAQTETA